MPAMFRRRHDEDDAPPRPPDRSWSSRIAWCTLVGGLALVVTRMSLATVVEVHGDGMAPTLVDSDHVVITRDPWSIERGDIVLYDPGLARPGSWDPQLEERFVEGPDGEHGPPDARRDPRGNLRNTGINVAMVDRDELETNWRHVQSRTDGIVKVDRGPLRLGRVLAVPGDAVTFHGEAGSLGLSVNGKTLPQKLSDPIRIRLEDDAQDGTAMRALAYETNDERRYPVLVRTSEDPLAWDGLELPPPEFGPVQIDAPGYLIVADNRDGGSCCDSRALGWLPDEAVRGRVLLRLSGDPGATPDLDPSARGVLWKP